MCDCIYLNLVLESEIWENTKNELTTDTKLDIGEESDDYEYCVLVRNLREESESEIGEEKKIQLNRRYGYLRNTRPARRIFETKDA